MSRLQLRILWMPAYAFVVVLCMTSALLIWLVWLLAQEVQQHQYQVVREARFDFGLNQIKTGFEAGLRLGLSPADVPLTQQRIDYMRGEQPDILSIDIFDAQGRVLFSTDHAGLGATMEGSWWKSCLNPTPAQAKGQDADSQWQCRSLIDGFDLAVAGVVLRHRLTPPVLSADWWSVHTWVRLAVGGLFLVASGAVGWSLARRLHATLLSWYRVLVMQSLATSAPISTSASVSAWPVEIDHIDMQDALSSLPATWVAGIQSWESLHTELAQAEIETEQIDEMEVI